MDKGKSEILYCTQKRTKYFINVFCVRWNYDTITMYGVQFTIKYKTQKMITKYIIVFVLLLSLCCFFFMRLTHHKPGRFFVQFFFTLNPYCQTVTGRNQLNFLLAVVGLSYNNRMQKKIERMGHKLFFCDFLNCCVGWYLYVSTRGWLRVLTSYSCFPGLDSD